MKKIYFLFIFAVLASMTSAFAATETIFYESFDQCAGKGGNDGAFSGSVANGTLVADVDGWNFVNGYGADACAKFGASKKAGTATTPALGFEGDATLTFRAAAWSGDNETLKVEIVNGGTLDQTSVSLVSAQWADFTVAIKGATAASQIKFESEITSKSRFFLDDVKIFRDNVDPSVLVAPVIGGAVEGATYYDETRNISITCLTEGAQIFYNVKKDGVTVAEKTDAVSPVELSLSEAGVYAIVALAAKDNQMSDVVTLNFTIATLPFEKMDPSAPKEGTYMIAAKGDDGKYYLMHNSVVANYYVGATEFDVTLGDPAKDTANLFFVEKAEGGYYIKNFDQAYVSLIKSGAHENLKPAEATPFVWTFGGTADAVVAGAADFTGTMRFKLYNGAPEFLCDDSSTMPVFLYVNSETSGVESVASASGVKAVAGGIEVVSDKAAEVIVVNASGQMVAVEAVAEGATLVEVPAGFYIVRTADEVVKVIVR